MPLHRAHRPWPGSPAGTCPSPAAPPLSAGQGPPGNRVRSVSTSAAPSRRRPLSYRLLFMYVFICMFLVMIPYMSADRALRDSEIHDIAMAIQAVVWSLRRFGERRVGLDPLPQSEVEVLRMVADHPG